MATSRSTARRARGVGLLPAAALLLLVAAPMAAAGSRNTPRVSADAANRVVPPEVQVKSQRPPIYPAAARAARVSGWVVVKATIDVEGKVKEATAIECTHLKVGLEQAAIAAVKSWKFRPALAKGEPVEYTTRYRLHFGRHSTGVFAATATHALMRRDAGVETQNTGQRSRRTGGEGRTSKGTTPSRR